ncbi:uncharacterized protein FAM237A isoform X2 [Sus scrofa]|uniref:uncharacterized protein FAM237A isoform X2 n=1 Tax=Sus scrofa TaxID=9823 RepID=UPI0006B215CA|nr:uncharacterized protein FAM237A isoform X2 [Sus scrofa]XP_013835132.1 uncharacterized protein FAM237A isoform X2 [Sus scrofa]
MRSKVRAPGTYACAVYCPHAVVADLCGEERLKTLRKRTETVSQGQSGIRMAAELSEGPLVMMLPGYPKQEYSCSRKADFSCSYTMELHRCVQKEPHPSGYGGFISQSTGRSRSHRSSERSRRTTWHRDTSLCREPLPPQRGLDFIRPEFYI